MKTNKKFKWIMVPAISLVASVTPLVFVVPLISSSLKNNQKKIGLNDAFAIHSLPSGFFIFKGFNGSGTIGYNHKKLNYQVELKLTKPNLFQKDTLAKEIANSNFQFRIKQINNLKNNDVLFAKFFVKDAKKYQLSEELKKPTKIIVKGLKEAPYDLKKYLSQFDVFKSNFISSDLYDKFHNLKLGVQLRMKELGLDSSLVELPSNLKPIYTLAKWDNKANTLQVQVELQNKEKDDTKILNNVKIFTIIGSNNYANVANKINNHVEKLTYEKNYKYDPNILFANKAPLQELDLQALNSYYKWQMPSNLSSNIVITDYVPFSGKWDLGNKKLTLKVKFKDTKAPKDLNFQNNEATITVYLYENGQLPDDIATAITTLKGNNTIDNPYQSSLSYSHLFNLSQSKNQGQTLLEKEFGFVTFPFKKNIKVEYKLNKWNAIAKVLEVKAIVSNTNKVNQTPEDITLNFKGNLDLGFSLDIIQNYFLNKTLSSSKTLKELTQYFSDLTKTSSQELDEQKMKTIFFNYQKSHYLTKGFELKFGFLEFNVQNKNLQLLLEINDSIAPLNSAFSHNKVKVNLKINPKYDFKNDLNLFQNFNSQYTYSQLYNKFNPISGKVAQKDGDIINPSSFGFITPKLSKSNIKVTYKLKNWDVSSKTLKVEVTLNDGNVLQSDSKVFEVKGSNDLTNELNKITPFYNVIDIFTKSEIQSHFHKFQQGDFFNFEKDLFEFNYNKPPLTLGIDLEYVFKSFDPNKLLLTLQAIIQDHNAPKSELPINNSKIIKIHFISAYDYEDFVDLFKQKINKEIPSLNGSALHNFFFKEGVAKYQKGDIINPNFFGYHTPLLIPKDIEVTYKFNSWDKTNNLLKIDVLLENVSIASSRVKLHDEPFTLSFYGKSDLASEVKKINFHSQDLLEYYFKLSPLALNDYLTKKIPLNQKFSFEQIQSIFGNVSYYDDLEKTLESIGFDKLTPGIKSNWTLTNISNAKNTNTILTFQVELEDSYSFKKNTNNTFNIKIQIIPRYDLKFFKDFFWKHKWFDLRNVFNFLSYENLEKYLKTWDGNIWHYYDLQTYFKKFFNYDYGSSWSFKQIMDKAKIIDPNTNLPLDLSDYDLTISFRGFDKKHKQVFFWLNFELKEATKQKYGLPPKMFAPGFTSIGMVFQLK